MINQESHVYSWNLGKIYLVHYLNEVFQNLKKVNSVDLSQISLLNMWLLAVIKWKFYVMYLTQICQALCS